MQEAIEQTTICLNCLTVNLFDNAFNDGIGWHIVCPVCEANYDIGIEEYLVPNGTWVKYFDNKKGFVDGNDSDIAKEYHDINYILYPERLELKRNQFKILGGISE